MTILFKKLLPFFIFIFLALGCTEEARQQQREKAEAEAHEQQAVEAREVVAKQLSKKFDMSPDCLFRFRASGTQSKTLFLENCSPTTARVEPERVLTAEDRTKLKNLGFDKVEVETFRGASNSYTSIYKFNDDATLAFVKYE